MTTISLSVKCPVSVALAHLHTTYDAVIVAHKACTSYFDAVERGDVQAVDVVAAARVEAKRADVAAWEVQQIARDVRAAAILDDKDWLPEVRASEQLGHDAAASAASALTRSEIVYGYTMQRGRID